MLEQAHQLTVLPEVCEGDSGAWVAHNAAPEVYGHVIATDILGDAYVMPSVDTLQEIKECMGAKSVRLPLGGSIISAKAETATISKSNATSKSRSMNMQDFESATNLPSTSYTECKLSEYMVEQTASGFDCSDDKTKDLFSLQSTGCEVDSSIKPQNAKSLTSPTPPLLRERIGQGIASAESSAGRTSTLFPSMHRADLNRESCYRSPYAKRWDPMFLQHREFKEDWTISYDQAKRSLSDDCDGIELFLQGFERSVPDCKIEELREFCGDTRLENLKAGTCLSGQQSSAWLDERSYPNRCISSQRREHKTPLTATQLYECLNTQVSDPPCL
jgi:hypothetical protein